MLRCHPVRSRSLLESLPANGDAELAGRQDDEDMQSSFMHSAHPQNCAEASNQVLTCMHCLYRIMKNILTWDKGF